jgi:hypothetical protein
MGGMEALADCVVCRLKPPFRCSTSALILPFSSALSACSAVSFCLASLCAFAVKILVLRLHKILAQRVRIRRPIFRQVHLARVGRIHHGDPEHLAQLALEERG